MKRKTIATIAAAILALAMTACGNEATTPIVDNMESTTETETTATIQLTESEDGTAYEDEVDAIEESVEESIEEFVEESTEDTEGIADETVEGTVAADDATTKETATVASNRTTTATEESLTVTSAGTNDYFADNYLVDDGQLDDLLDSLFGTADTDNGYSMELVEGTPISELIASADSNDVRAPHDAIGDWLNTQANTGASTGSNGNNSQAARDAQNTQSTSAPTPTAAPAPAPAPAVACNHDWQPCYRVVDTYEELQDVEVWGVQCIVCGLKGEYQHSLGDHVMTCEKLVWNDLAGCYTYESGSRPYTETRQEMVTVEVTKHGWKCSICGEEQGLE